MGAGEMRGGSEPSGGLTARINSPPPKTHTPTPFFPSKQCGLGMATTLASSVKGGSQLADLRQCDMFKVMVAFAECVKAMHEKVRGEHRERHGGDEGTTQGRGGRIE